MILLINPPFYRFLGLQQDYVPLSLLAVGSKMSDEGEKVLIKNMEVGGNHYAGYSERSTNYDIFIEALNNPEHEVWQELRATIKKYQPNKIGINVLNVKYKSALKVIDIAKEYGIPVMVGGNHPTTEPDSYPKDVEVFCGEYESNGTRLLNLNDASFPNFDILLDKYSPNGYAHILSARGCPFSCLQGDTEIDTIEGIFKIKDLVGKFPFVLTRNPKTFDVEYAKASNVFMTKVDAELIRIHFNNGDFIDCTPDHIFMTFKNGNQNSETTEQEKRADELKKGESVRAIHYGKTKQGYIDVIWGRRKRRRKSRLIMDAFTGRRLTRKDLVHHLDRNKINDVLNNLVLTNDEYHISKYHPEVSERMKTNNAAKNMTKEQRIINGQNGRGKKRSYESRLRYRLSKLGDKNPRYKDGSSKHKSRILEINHVVVSIEKLSYREDVYCMEVPGYDWFYANQVLVHNCSFCASKIMWNRKVTYKSIDRILTEMYYIYFRFHSDYFTFWDETFTVNKTRITEFCKRYKLPSMWRCDTRADSITDDMVRMMKSAGCGQMSLGLESGDNGILEYIKKGETTDDFLRAAEILNNNGIFWKAYMIIGFPKDTEETILKSIEFVKSLKPFRITLSFFTPYKGTDLYEETKALGLINDDYDMSLYSHQSPHNYFCPLITKERYFEIRDLITKDIDDYNKEALKSWT